MKFVVPFGYYGIGNIGDEAMLQGFRRLIDSFDPRSRVWCASRNLRHTRQIEPNFRYFVADARDIRRRWAWRTCDAMVVPGGTPIMDSLGNWPFNELLPFVARAKREGKPIAFIGAGTEQLGRQESRAMFNDFLAENVTYWTVRSRADRNRLIQLGVQADRVVAAADQAWMLQPVSTELGRSVLGQYNVDPSALLVGVNVNFESAVRAQHPNMLRTMAAFLDDLVRSRNAHVVLMCTEVRDGETFDLAACRELVSLMTQKQRATVIPNKYWSPQAMMSLVACCRVTFSTRYHFCLFSALQGVPFLAVTRSDKVADLCDDLGWQFGVDLDGLSHDQLASSFDALYAQKADLPGRLKTLAFAMRERAQLNSLALERLRQLVNS